MENSKVEKAEIERFNSLLIRTISFAIMYPGVFLIRLLPSGHMALIAFIILAVLFLIFMYATIRGFYFSRKIKNDPALKQALTNEMYRSFDSKARATGYCLTLFLTVILYILNEFYVDIPIDIALPALLYVGIVAPDLHKLFLYKP